VPLQQAIPVYVTYLTVGATPDGPAFRADPYNRDKVVLERFAEAGDGMADANRPFQIDLSDLVEPSSEEIPAAKPLSAAAKPQPKAARPSALPTSKSTTDKAATVKAVTAKETTTKATTTKAATAKAATAKAATAKAATAKAATAKETTAKAATQKGPTTKAVTKKPALQAPPLLNPLNTSPSKSSRPLPAKTKLSASVAPSEKRTGQKR
jgi:murein L,D-transpeptidase YcbB/YkuD